jgi:hypothetical protein
MFNRENAAHYFYVGRSNLWMIQNIVNIRASYFEGDSKIESNFDFGCGHGKLLWVKAFALFG